MRKYTFFAIFGYSLITFNSLSNFVEIATIPEDRLGRWSLFGVIELPPIFQSLVYLVGYVLVLVFFIVLGNKQKNDVFNCRFSVNNNINILFV